MRIWIAYIPRQRLTSDIHHPKPLLPISLSLITQCLRGSYINNFGVMDSFRQETKNGQLHDACLSTA